MADGREIKRAAVRSVFWVSVDKWGTRLLSLAMFSMLGRLLGPADFGLVALAAVFTTILSVFVDSGFSQVLVQRATVSSVQISTAFWTSNALALLMYAALAAVAHPLSVLYGEPSLDGVLYVLGLQLPITALASTPGALLVREFAFKTLAIRQLSGVTVGLVAGGIAAYQGLGVWSLAIQTVGGSAVSCVVLWTASGWRPTFEYSVDVLKEMWEFGISVLGTEAMLLVNGQADKLLVGSLLGPTSLGYYYVGGRIVSLVSDSLTVVIARVSLTTFSRLQEDRPRMMRAFTTATFVSACVALPVFGVLAVVAPILVPLLFGAQWDSAVPIMQLLVPSAALVSILYFDKNVLLAQGFAKDTFWLTVWNVVLGLVLLLAAAPWGAVGIAASRSIRQFAFWPVRLILLRRRLGLRPAAYLRQFLQPLVAATASTLVAAVVVREVGPDLVALVCAGGAAAVTYVLLLWLLARRRLTEVLDGILPARDRRPWRSAVPAGRGS
jgi:O-antigen/teichoic acid export membrane protein